MRVLRRPLFSSYAILPVCTPQVILFSLKIEEQRIDGKKSHFALGIEEAVGGVRRTAPDMKIIQSFSQRSHRDHLQHNTGTPYKLPKKNSTHLLFG